MNEIKLATEKNKKKKQHRKQKEKRKLNQDTHDIRSKRVMSEKKEMICESNQ